MEKNETLERMLDYAIQVALKLSLLMGLLLSYFAVHSGYSIELGCLFGILTILVSIPIMVLSAVAWVFLASNA